MDIPNIWTSIFQQYVNMIIKYINKGIAVVYICTSVVLWYLRF
jgi:hypothetical protein